MLTGPSFDIAQALRRYVGPDKAGVGPDITQFLAFPELSGNDPAEIRDALEDLESLGFIKISRAIATDGAVPKVLRGMIGLAVMEPLQQFFDDIEG